MPFNKPSSCFDFLSVPTLWFLFLAVLRDQRYKLLHYSKGELSIQLSNVTVQDGGNYSCFHYSSQFQSKNHNVQILGKFVWFFYSRGAEQSLKCRPAFFHGAQHIILLLAHSPPIMLIKIVDDPIPPKPSSPGTCYNR